MPKKVGSITLEHEENGVMVSNAYDAEFNDAIISGDISALEGTFAGRLSADCIEVIDNLHIAGRAVAITKVDRWESVTGWDDDRVYRNVCQQMIEVPQGMNGAFCAVAIQYKISDQRWDNDLFMCRYRISLDGNPYYTNDRSFFGTLYRVNNHHIHEIVVWLSGAGYHTVSLAYMFEPNQTNVYPVFENVIMRSDLIRK